MDDVRVVGVFSARRRVARVRNSAPFVGAVHQNERATKKSKPVESKLMAFSNEL